MTSDSCLTTLDPQGWWPSIDVESGAQVLSLLWIALPYSAFVSFAAGMIWLRRRRRFYPSTGWGQSQFLAANAFRCGLILAFGARLADLLAAGPHDHPRGGTHAAITLIELIAIPFALAGAALLLVPPLIRGEQRAAASHLDHLTMPILAGALLSGVIVESDPSSVGRYRVAETLFPWFRSLFTLHPHADTIVDAPAIYQARGVILMLLIAIWPYTRLADLFRLPRIPWRAIPLRLLRDAVKGAWLKVTEKRMSQPRSPGIPAAASAQIPQPEGLQ
jgi:nitrate reductase gamma subunit